MFSGDEIAAVGLGDGRAGDLPVLRRRAAGLLRGDGLDELFAAGELAIGERPVGVERSVTLPSATVRAAASQLQCSAAISISIWRAAAAIVRRLRPHRAAWSGCRRCPCRRESRSVSPMTMVMASNGTVSSSATCCASEVRMFWPTSTLPVKTLTWPSAAMCSQAPDVLGKLVAAEGCGPTPAPTRQCAVRQTSRPPPRSLQEVAAVERKLRGGLAVCILESIQVRAHRGGLIGCASLGRAARERRA